MEVNNRDKWAKVEKQRQMVEVNNRDTWHRQTTQGKTTVVKEEGK